MSAEKGSTPAAKRRILERLQWFHDNDTAALWALAETAYRGVPLPREEGKRLHERGLVDADGVLAADVQSTVLNSVRVLSGQLAIVS